MAIDTISRALSGQASTAAKQAKETADSAMEQAIAAVPGAVSDWLEDNVTPTTPVVDASLSIARAAADAKATGDGIADLKSAVYQEYTLSGWQKGVFNASGLIVSSFNGTVSPSTVYVVGTKVHLEENCYATVAYYGDSGYIGKVAANGSINQTADDWKYFTSDFNSFDYAPSGAKFIQIALYVTDSTTITTDNVQTWTNSNCTLYKPIPIQNSVDIEKINDQMLGTYALANWIKGTETGTGDILTNYNSTLSPERVYIVEAHVSLTENCNATLFFYNDTEYLGKVGASGSVNKTGGDWKYFTGDFDPSYYAPSTAKYFRLSLFPQDGTTISSENIQTWTNNNCTITYLIPVKNKIDISTYGGDIEEINNRYGRYAHTFTPPASTSHSSRNDGVYVDIEQGEPFTVKISGLVAAQPEIFAFYNNQANYSKLGTGLEWVGVAPHAVEYIGVAYTDQATFPSGSVTIEVYKNNQIYGKTQKISDYKNIITTVLGADIPNDINKYTISSAYATKMKEAIDAWMAYYAGDDKIIPFIVHTDQHGRLTAAWQGIFNLLDYLVNWDGVSAIFNLGDTVVDHWEDDNTNVNPLLRNATLEAARICLENIPKEKRIDVYGNHDTWYFNGSVTTAVSGTLPSLKYLNPYFLSDGLVTKKLPDNSGLEVVYDNKRNVKYLVLAGWDYADKTGQNVGYQWYWINQDHLNWMVDEMTKNDGYDLVLVSHVPLQMGYTGCVDPITGSSITETVPWYITHCDPYLIPLWNARKNKTNGSVSSNGVSVTYDFRKCETDCLCALSGHTHYDGVQYLNNANNGLLDTSFDWFQNQTIHFGVIDRRARKIKVWKLANDSNTPSVTSWEKPLDKA